MKRFFITALSILLLAACNYPTAPSPTLTPNVQYVTATPHVGPYQATREVAFAEPSYDIADLSTVAPIPATQARPPLQPTPSFTPPPTSSGAPTSSGTPTNGGTPTSIAPTATLPPTITPTATVPTAAPTQTPSPTALPPSPTPPATASLEAGRMGINFINSAQLPAGPERMQLGIDAGASWDRYPIYWYDVEQSEGRYVWAMYDEAVRRTVASGLNLNMILLGAPTFYREPDGVPVRINEPVFADGTDTPAPGKALNPNNAYAQWVYATVNRYKPGGVLAGQEGWAAGQGVTYWEVWNEPDLSIFWQGSAEDYARLMKVAYLAIRQADPGAQVMVGGMVIFEQPDFLPRVLDYYKNDPDPVAGRYPFDIFALHAYSHPAGTFYIIQRTETLLALHGLLGMPIWLNESGVPLWNDYPGPTWAQRPDQRIWRATLSEQAAFIPQNAAFSFMAGVDVYFHFQLFDDCGNQPKGSDFPPHDGSLCVAGATCWGDAHGLVRNGRSNDCFTQHPQPGTKRPAYDVYQYTASLFADGTLEPLEMFTVGKQRWAMFARPTTGELVTFLWHEGGQPTEAAVIARSQQAQLWTMDGVQTITPNERGLYIIPLEPATNQNAPPELGIEYMLGGRPVILTQQTEDSLASVLPLLETNRTAFVVKWNGSRSNLTDWEVWYRDDTGGADWQLWLEPEGPGEALFVGGEGRKYSFFARAKTPDGEWTRDTFEVQAYTITN